MSTDSIHRSTVSKLRHLCVYQPSTALRCVQIIVSNDGTFEARDLHVVAIQATSSDVFRAKGNPKIGLGTDTELADAGFHPDPTNGNPTLVQHQLVVIKDGAPLVLDEGEDRDTGYVIGAASSARHWWDQEIASKAEEIRQAMGIRMLTIQRS